MTRGPYNTKRKKAQPDDEPEKLAAVQMTYQQIVDKLVSESTIKGELTKVMLAEAVAALRIQLKVLLKKQANGTIASDEVRAIPACASNIRRLCDSLGATEPEEEELDDL